MARESIALERIQILFSLAKARFDKYPQYSHRYVQLARQISMRTNTPVPTELKRSMCKKCSHYLVIGRNATLRVRSKNRIIVCTNCTNAARYPLK